MRVSRSSSGSGQRFAGLAGVAASPRALGAGRALAGVAMLARPGAVSTIMGADAQTARGSAWAVQMLGAREVGLGLGSIAGLRGDEPAGRTWLVAGVVVDALDALALVAGVRAGRVPRGSGLAVSAMAAGAVGIGVRALAARPAAPG